MEKAIQQKIRALTKKATRGKVAGNLKRKQLDSNMPNSLADHIKTAEQARIFMLLLNSLQK